MQLSHKEKKNKSEKANEKQKERPSESQIKQSSYYEGGVRLQKASELEK